MGMSEARKISKRRRDILVVSPSYGTDGDEIGTAAAHLIAEMSANDLFHFTWAAGDYGNRAENYYKELTAENANGEGLQEWDEDPAILPMPVRELSGRGWRTSFWKPAAFSRLRDAVERADVVWLHDTFYAGSVAAFFMARRGKKPILITKHRGASRIKGGGRFPALIESLVADRMLAHATQVTFTSDAVAENYYRRIAFSAPVKIIPNGVDLNVFRPASMEHRRNLRHSFSLRDTTPVLLFEGNFSEIDGLFAVRHLASLLRDWHFWLVGQGATDPAAWQMPNVHVFAEHAEGKLADLYQSADRLILPSAAEHFPLSIQKAMACGLPVMTSPAMAAGNQLAKPHILTVPVYATEPDRTAALWAEQLKKQRTLLPLTHPKIELADLAHIFWQWPKIANHYADILAGLTR
jgi:glycosyltransferase involved in cell wall biosynthesis